MIARKGDEFIDVTGPRRTGYLVCGIACLLGAVVVAVVICMGGVS